MLSKAAPLVCRLARRYCTKSAPSNAPKEVVPKQAGAAAAPQEQTPPPPSPAESLRLHKWSTGRKLAMVTLWAISGWALYEQLGYVRVQGEIDDLKTGADKIKQNDLFESRSPEIGIQLDRAVELLSARRRSFSGDVVVKLEPGKVKKWASEIKLLDTLKLALGDSANRWKALTILEQLAKFDQSARDFVLQPDIFDGLVNQALLFDPTFSPHNEWLLAANIIAESVPSSRNAEQLRQASGVNRLLATYEQSRNPMARIISGRLFTSFGITPVPTGLSENAEREIIGLGLSEARAFEPHFVSGASAASAIAFAIAGGFWVRTRWAIFAMRTLKFGTYARISHRFSVVRPFLIWFLLDMFGQRLLSFASNDSWEFNAEALQSYKVAEAQITHFSGVSMSETLNSWNKGLQCIPHPKDISLANAVTIGQNLSFTLFAYYMILTRHFVFVPLMAAGIYNHFEELQKIPLVSYAAQMAQLQADAILSSNSKTPPPQPL